MNLQQHNAIQWFRQFLKVGKLNKRNYKVAKHSDDHRGKILLFNYSPKNKNSLPYYDTLPLVLITGKVPGGFTGINLHYLPPGLRMKFVLSLLKLSINKNNINVNQLKRLSKNVFFRVAVKQYINSHVQGNMVSVPVQDWQNVAYLSLEQFKKQSNRHIWEDTIDAIKKISNKKRE